MVKKTQISGLAMEIFNRQQLNSIHHSNNKYLIQAQIKTW